MAKKLSTKTIEVSREELCVELAERFIEHFSPHIRRGMPPNDSSEEIRDFMFDWYFNAKESIKALPHHWIHGTATTEEMNARNKSFEDIKRNQDKLGKVNDELRKTLIDKDQELDTVRRSFELQIEKTNEAFNSARVPKFVHLHNRAQWTALHAAQLVNANQKLRVQISDFGGNPAFAHDWAYE